jgi:hypothetical protein
MHCLVISPHLGPTFSDFVVSAQVAGDIRQKAEKWHSFFSNLSR